MTHRDELLALQARVEAQAREIDDAQSEISLLRAAHAQKTREVATLRRTLGERHEGDLDETGAPRGYGPDGPDDPTPQRRSFGFAAAMIGGVALASTMMIAAGGPCGAHRSRAHLPPMVQTFERVGHVVEGSDPAIAQPGEVCTVRREPAIGGGGLDCRIEIRCGEHTIYGASPESGYVRCAGRQVIRDSQFTARDGDPAMELDLRHGRVVVEEQLGLGTQRVEIALSGFGEQ
ncbi:MAG: hypothetical protein M3Y87_06265 [Myxococcota bacterium]|nr:hypothetical protein [Myxococcota bacterium]